MAIARSVLPTPVGPKIARTRGGTPGIFAGGVHWSTIG